jgi:hypothetical protein
MCGIDADHASPPFVHDLCSAAPAPHVAAMNWSRKVHCAQELAISQQTSEVYKMQALLRLMLDFRGIECEGSTRSRSRPWEFHCEESVSGLARKYQTW